MKLTPSDIIHNIDVQSEIAICYYDETAEERVGLDYEMACDCEILYMYEEKGVIFLEVEKPKECYYCGKGKVKNDH